MGMAELGDEDMFGVAPKVIHELIKTDFSFGYWVDNRGVRHFGRKPSTTENVEMGDMVERIRVTYGEGYNERDIRLKIWNEKWKNR